VHIVSAVVFKVLMLFGPVGGVGGVFFFVGGLDGGRGKAMGRQSGLPALYRIRLQSTGSKLERKPRSLLC